jgi:hypothetical protein
MRGDVLALVAVQVVDDPKKRKEGGVCRRDVFVSASRARLVRSKKKATLAPMPVPIAAATTGTKASRQKSIY